MWHYPSMSIIYIPIIKIWQFFVSTITFYLLLSSFCISMNGVTYSSWYFFWPLITYWYQLISLVLLLLVLLRKRAGSSSYISRYIFQKLPNTSADNNASLWTYKSWYFPKNFISKYLQALFACVYSALVISSVFAWL